MICMVRYEGMHHGEERKAGQVPSEEQRFKEEKEEEQGKICTTEQSRECLYVGLDLLGRQDYLVRPTRLADRRLCLERNLLDQPDLSVLAPKNALPDCAVALFQTNGMILCIRPTFHSGRMI